MENKYLIYKDNVMKNTIILIIEYSFKDFYDEIKNVCTPWNIIDPNSKFSMEPYEYQEYGEDCYYNWTFDILNLFAELEEKVDIIELMILPSKVLLENPEATVHFNNDCCKVSEITKKQHKKIRSITIKDKNGFSPNKYQY